MFGYFDVPEQTTPSHDPGMGANCLLCNNVLSPPVKTISLMLDGDTRSYFYRTHADCYDRASVDEIQTVESGLIDAIARTKTDLN